MSATGSPQDPPHASLTTAELHRMLRHGDITECKGLPWGSNYTFAVVSEFEGLPPTVGIYKPRRGEIPLWDFPQDTLYRREYAAYLLSQALGWDFVPPTVVRQGPHGIGSVQLYIEPDVSVDYPAILERFPEELMRFALFDTIANNADRKASHCLVDTSGRLWGIDHGLTFNVAPKLRTVIWEFRGEPVPPHLLDELRAFCADSARTSWARTALGAWLLPEEVAMTFRRLEALIAAGRFPVPSPHGRNVPWPPF